MNTKTEADSHAVAGQVERPVMPLLPCPFCGNDAHLVDDLIMVHAECSSCGATGAASSYTSGAAKAWNRRADRKANRPSICTDCSNADSWGLPDKPCCRSCVSGNNWQSLNTSSVNPNGPAQPAPADGWLHSSGMAEHACREIEVLRAKLDQATVALKDISNDNWPDADLNAGEYACLVLHELAAGARPVEPVQKLRPDFIAGYDAGMADAKRIQAAQPAQGAGDQVQMILKHRLMRKVEGDWLAASEFMTGEPDPSWLAKVKELPEEWRIEQGRRVSGEQIQAGLTRAFASWKKPAPAAVAGKTERWNPLDGGNAQTALQMTVVIGNRDIQPSPEAQADAKDAARWRYAVEIGGNQRMNWLDVYDDWDGDGSFADAIDVARAADKKEPT